MNIFLRHVWKNALVCWSMISLTFKFQRWVSIYYVKIQKQLTLSMCDYISVLVISIFLAVKMIRSCRPELFLKKDVLKISSKFTEEHPCQSAILIKLQSHPCRSAILIKLQSNLIETTLRHGCSPVNLLHIFRIPFLKDTSGRLFLNDLRIIPRAIFCKK